MKVDLVGDRLLRLGAREPVAEACVAALLANGASLAEPPTILFAALPLLPDEGFSGAAWRSEVEAAAGAMGPGSRVVLLMSAVAGMPMRRHPGFSVEMAAMLAVLRGLAMRLAPVVRVNAVGAGAIGAPLMAGDAAMLGHASVGRPGTVAEVVDAVLFLCDPINTYLTGQMLAVDGGWSAGYGRSF